METINNIQQYQRFSNRSMCLHIFSNITNNYRSNENLLLNHIEELNRRRLLFCRGQINNYKESQYAVNGNCKVDFLMRELRHLSKYNKENISFKTLDRYFISCIFIYLAIIFLAVIQRNIDIILAISFPLITLFVKCLYIEVSTKQYSTISIYINKLSVQMSDNEEKQPGCNITEKDVVLSCVAMLEKNNIINVTSDLLKSSYTTLDNLSKVSQIQLATYLNYYIKKEKIKIKGNCTEKSLTDCIGLRMKHADGNNLNAKSFEVEFNRVKKASEEYYNKLVEKHII